MLISPDLRAGTRPDALSVDPAAVSELRVAPGAFGSWEPVRVEAERLELRESTTLMAGAGFAALAVGVAVGAALLLPALGLAVWIPIALPAAALGLWACLRALASVSPATLRVDGAHAQVLGVDRARWLARPRWRRAEDVEAVLLETRQVRPASGSGQHSVAEITLALRDGRRLRGPRSEERALARWQEARDQLLPLAVTLARLVGRPLRLRYLGWPEHREPIERVAGADP